jgi:hypothetical protein
MDAKRFDALTRSLTDTVLSRRRVLTGMTGSAFGVLAASLGVAPAEAGNCRKRQRSCTKTKQCCGHKRTGVICAPLSTGTTCESGLRCCGTQGTPCDNTHCDCCEGFLCSAVTFKCQQID